MSYRVDNLLCTSVEFETLQQLQAWFQGLTHGIWAFAHYKDGICYVGTTGKTYGDMLQEIKIAYEKATGLKYEDIA